MQYVLPSVPAHGRRVVVVKIYAGIVVVVIVVAGRAPSDGANIETARVVPKVKIHAADKKAHISKSVDTFHDSGTGN